MDERSKDGTTAGIDAVVCKCRWCRCRRVERKMQRAATRSLGTRQGNQFQGCRETARVLRASQELVPLNARSTLLNGANRSKTG